MSPDIISTFLEMKNPKGIVQTISCFNNDANQHGEMFDKIKNFMKNENILFEENIYIIIGNIINEK